MTAQEQIINALQEAANAIKANLQANGVNASGRTSDSVRVRRTEDNHVQLVIGNYNDHTIPGPPEAFGGDIIQRDTAPAFTLEAGRGPGRVPRGFYYILREWATDKGIPNPGRVAYFTAQKIKEQGTERHNAPRDNYSSVAETAAAKIMAIIKSQHARAVLDVVKNKTPQG